MYGGGSVFQQDFIDKIYPLLKKSQLAPAVNPARKIVLITSGQPSLNPRLVKEADTLAEAGYAVTVIYQYWNNWGTVLDKTLLTQKKWAAIRVGGKPGLKNSPVYWLSRVKHKAAQFIARNLKIKSMVTEPAIGRCTGLLADEACRHKASIYIAHNLAALPAAVRASRRNNAKCGV